jgi:uncharacterized protein YndB with AHSA1/START domain
MKNESAATTHQPVRIERSYDGPVDDLWDLWTTKDGFESWWGPEGFRVEVSAIEPRVGGQLDYDMIAARAEEIAFLKQACQAVRHGVQATFFEFDPKRRLRLRSRIDFIPGIQPYDNDILVDFIPEGTRVRMVVEIEPHRDEHWTRMATRGFESQLTKLPTALEARRRRS